MEVYWDGPFVVLPVVRTLGVQREGPGFRSRVGDEGLQECGTDVVPVVLARKRPDMVCQHSVGPGALLLEGNGRRTGTPLAAAQKLIGGRWQQEDRALTSDQTVGTGLLGREEQALRNVAKPELMP